MLPVLSNNPSFAPFAGGPVNRLESFFDRVFGDDSGLWNPWNPSWTNAPLAMWEDDDHVLIETDLPGVADTDVEITVHNGMLFIRGERKPEAGRQYLYNGRSYGRFERVVTLPAGVDTNDVQARLTNGVLHIALPKSPEARPKKIALTAN